MAYECDILDCPKNKLFMPEDGSPTQNICELNRTPKNCTHRIFKLRNKDGRVKGKAEG